MKGLTINGYLVVEVLGSGQAGILYLARDAEGREAIVRVARDSEDNVSIRVFQEEAARLLPSVANVITSDALDGRKVLMATPAGGGATRHAETQRLPPHVEVPPPRRASVVLLLASLALVAASAVFFLLSSQERRARASAASSGVTPTSVEVTRFAEPGASELSADAAVPVAATEPASPAAAHRDTTPRPVARRPDCTPDERWKRMMQLNLREVDARANALSALEVEREVMKLGAAVERAASPAECSAVNAQFEALVKRAIKPGG